MTTKDVIKNATKPPTIVHAYDDGTYLFDILVGDKVYTIRTTLDVLESQSPN